MIMPIKTLGMKMVAPSDKAPKDTSPGPGQIPAIPHPTPNRADPSSSRQSITRLGLTSPICSDAPRSLRGSHTTCSLEYLNTWKLTVLISTPDINTAIKVGSHPSDEEKSRNLMTLLGLHIPLTMSPTPKENPHSRDAACTDSDDRMAFDAMPWDGSLDDMASKRFKYLPAIIAITAIEVPGCRY